MGQTRSHANGQCPACGELNDAGMAFCMFCGDPLRFSKTKVIPGLNVSEGHKCPSCGKFDPLCERFCIFCGAETSPDPKLMACDTAEIPIPNSAIATPNQKLPPILLAAPTGVVLGLILGLLVIRPNFEMAVAKQTWPGQGLVIYASPPGCQVTVVESLERNFTLGNTGPKGELALCDLPPGSYHVSISHPQYESFSCEVRIEPKQVVPIGFPKRIELKRSG